MARLRMSVLPASTPLGEMLRLYRAAHQLGLRELAGEVGGVSSATLMRVEAGHQCDARTFMRLMAWLVGGVS